MIVVGVSVIWANVRPLRRRLDALTPSPGVKAGKWRETR